MNSVIDTTRTAELNRDSITQLVNQFVFASHMAVPGVTAVHFERWLQLRALHTRTVFDCAKARHLRKVASNIARNLYSGYFGNAAGFDVIALETRHGVR